MTSVAGRQWLDADEEVKIERNEREKDIKATIIIQSLGLIFFVEI
jgi:hypothetical protein